MQNFRQNMLLFVMCYREPNFMLLGEEIRERNQISCWSSKPIVRSSPKTGGIEHRTSKEPLHLSTAFVQPLNTNR